MMRDIAELKELLFNTEKSRSVTDKILNAFFVTSQADILMNIASNDKDLKIRRGGRKTQTDGRESRPRRAIEGVLRDCQREVKEAVIEALFVQGAVQETFEIARAETDLELRKAAGGTIESRGQAHARSDRPDLWLRGRIANCVKK
ncbi:MAG: hypothetical protein M2R45_05162 [Verrucomicrobia subdivision 3 bacterium]|nr:hypothetical protein [Limisphaerales bacterium]MCS1413805.1 hypothetical protein [Limisphaerales bacterium]